MGAIVWRARSCHAPFDLGMQGLRELELDAEDGSHTDTARPGRLGVSPVPFDMLQGLHRT